MGDVLLVTPPAACSCAAGGGASGGIADAGGGAAKCCGGGGGGGGGAPELGNGACQNASWEHHTQSNTRFALVRVRASAVAEPELAARRRQALYVHLRSPPHCSTVTREQRKQLAGLRARKEAQQPYAFASPSPVQPGFEQRERHLQVVKPPAQGTAGRRSDPRLRSSSHWRHSTHSSTASRRLWLLYAKWLSRRAVSAVNALTWGRRHSLSH